MSLRDSIIEEIRARGPMTFARFMERALYDPDRGYYSREAQRSGRAGDFYTSVDVGPLFGEMLALQIAEMWRLLTRGDDQAARARPFMLIEAGAGNGRLSRDLLDGLARTDSDAYANVELYLVERSAAARRVHQDVLGPHRERLRGSSEHLPAAITGVIFANELLDALPVHRVLMTEAGLSELYVNVRDDRLFEEPGPPSSVGLTRYLEALGITLEAGTRAEIGMAAETWVRSAARQLRQGFLVLIDYGHEAPELYSAAPLGGTLRTFERHRSDPENRADSAEPWLSAPGDRDLTASVDFTTIEKAATDEGLEILGVLDQTYFLLGLGIARNSSTTRPDDVAEIRRRMALRTLMLPGGLGSTHKVLIAGRGVGRPALASCSYKVRMT